MKIVILERKLSDGSRVFNVRFAGVSGITLSAVSKYDAYELAHRIAAAINEHTNETAEVV